MYVIAMEVEHEDPYIGRVFVKLGVFTEQEATELSKEGIIKPDVSEVITTSMGRHAFSINEGQQLTTTQEVVIESQSAPVKYIYGDAKANTKFNPIKIFQKWKREFFAQKEDGYKIELANEREVESNLKIFIPTSKTIRDSKVKNKALLNSTFPLGVPLLWISGWKRSSATDQTGESAEQFIQLIPKKLNTKNKTHVNKYLTPIRNYIADIKELHAEIDKFNLPVLPKLGDVNFANFIIKMSNLYYSVENGISLGKTFKPTEEDQNYGFLFKQFGENFHKKPEFKRLLELTAKIDTHIHGDIAKRQQKRRSHGGPAQLAFDAIASVNLKGSTSKGIIILRDTRLSREYEKIKSKTKEVVGRSLLGQQSGKEAAILYDDVMNAHIDGWKNSMIDRFIKRLTQQFGKEVIELAEVQEQIEQEKSALGEKMPRSKIVEHDVKMADGTVANRTTLNLEELEELFGDQAFDKKGNSTNVMGFGLRVPVPLQKFHNKVIKTATLPSDPTSKVIAIGELQDYFEDSFEKVLPTRLVINFNIPGSTPKKVSEVTKERILTADVQEKLEARAKSRQAVTRKKTGPVAPVAPPAAPVSSITPTYNTQTETGLTKKPIADKSKLAPLTEENATYSFADMTTGFMPISTPDGGARSVIKDTRGTDAKELEEKTVISRFIEKDGKKWLEIVKWSYDAVGREGTLKIIVDVTGRDIDLSVFNTTTLGEKSTDFATKAAGEKFKKDVFNVLFEQTSSIENESMAAKKTDITVEDALEESGLTADDLGMDMKKYPEVDPGILIPDEEVQSVVNRYNPESFKRLA
jgi:hypothetical protein